MPKRLATAGQASACVLDCDRIIVPVHQGQHWVCAVVDLQHQRLLYYDSLKVGGHTAGGCLAAARLQLGSLCAAAMRCARHSTGEG